MKQQPNVILFLVDDLGYGDVSCLNENSKIHTEHIDRLAQEGMRFTDAHSSSSVCTPSRYGILTGRYNWRSSLKRGVIPGYAPPLIEEGRMTLGSMFQRQGYQTAAVGKWHLGMDWACKDGFQLPRTIPEIDPDNMGVDFTGKIENGPLTRGFDYFYGMGGSLDQSPYVIVENDHAIHQPDHYVGTKGFEPFEKGAILEKDYGPCAPDFDFQQVVPMMHAKMLEMVETFAKNGKPFFLYAPTPAVHGPLLPTEEFVGKSGIGPYGDFVLQVDDFIGRLECKLAELGVADNTIIIFTSDNGCAPIVDPQGLHERTGHNPSYVYRGCKFDIWEGGHRVPLIVKWPGNIPQGVRCDETVCLVDFFATLADVTGFNYGDDAAEDSVSLLPLWKGGAEPVREATVHHSGSGKYSVRKGKWKLELCAGSGGVSAPAEGRDDLSGLPDVQLYDLTADIGERANVQGQHPEVVRELRDLLAGYIFAGRSTPGKTRKNEPAAGRVWPGLEWMNV